MQVVTRLRSARWRSSSSRALASAGQCSGLRYLRWLIGVGSYRIGEWLRRITHRVTASVPNHASNTYIEEMRVTYKATLNG